MILHTGSRAASRHAALGYTAANHLFLRHPPLPDSAGLCYGRLDITLDASVFTDAAASLQDRLPSLPILSSPAQRCIGLARAMIRKNIQGQSDTCDIATDPRLLEMNFGAWEGQPWSELPRAALDHWALDVAHYCPPNGESFSNVVARLRAVLDELQAPHLIVTHAGVIRAAKHLLGNTAINEAAAWHVPYLEPIAFV